MGLGPPLTSRADLYCLIYTELQIERFLTTKQVFIIFLNATEQMLKLFQEFPATSIESPKEKKKEQICLIYGITI